MAPSVGIGGTRTHDLVLFKDVVPPAFVTNSNCKMATRVDENSQPASRPAGRNLNPLVANVFPSAFAIKFQKAARQSGARQLLSYSVCTEPGYEPGPPGFHRALYHVVLRAFPPLQISQRSITVQNRPTSSCRDLTVLDVVPGGIRPAKLFPSRPATSELT